MTCDECGTYCAGGIVGLIGHYQRRHHVDLPSTIARRARANGGGRPAWEHRRPADHGDDVHDVAGSAIAQTIQRARRR